MCIHIIMMAFEYIFYEACELTEPVANDMRKPMIVISGGRFSARMPPLFRA